MTEVTGWVFTICSGALICGVVSALIPGKNYEGAIQLLLGLFMLFCFLAPITMDWELPSVDLEAAEEKRMEAAGELEDKLSAQVERDSVQKLTETAARALEQYGIGEAEIEITLAADDQGKACAVVSLPRHCMEQHRVLHRLLEYEFGIPVSIEYSGGDGSE